MGLLGIPWQSRRARLSLDAADASLCETAGLDGTDLVRKRIGAGGGRWVAAVVDCSVSAAFEVVAPVLDLPSSTPR